MKVKYLAMPTAIADTLRNGGVDANQQQPERTVSDGSGNPCRHCLQEIPAGNTLLILAWRPFTTVQPYAEVGPVFLCGKPCARHPESSQMPAMFGAWHQLLLRGYSRDERIVYGSGQVRAVPEVPMAIEKLLAQPEIEFVHLRSASNNCFQCRVEIAAPTSAVLLNEDSPGV